MIRAKRWGFGMGRHALYGWVFQIGPWVFQRNVRPLRTWRGWLTSWLISGLAIVPIVVLLTVLFDIIDWELWALFVSALWWRILGPLANEVTESIDGE